MIAARARISYASLASVSKKAKGKWPATEPSRLLRRRHQQQQLTTAASASDDNNSNNTPQPQHKKTVTVAWVTADGRRGEVTATPGDNLLEVATRAAAAAGEGDAAVETGCFSGSCGLCEVEVRGVVVRSCVGVVPSGFDAIEVRALSDDASWGIDAWDT